MQNSFEVHVGILVANGSKFSRLSRNGTSIPLGLEMCHPLLNTGPLASGLESLPFAGETRELFRFHGNYATSTPRGNAVSERAKKDVTALSDW